ncbi:MAG TPA: glycosyltransferase [Roseiflexaceae bacterium]
MAPFVSILMAVYNGATFLPTAIESVLAQQMANLELVIGDNVSTDATAEIAQRYARHDQRVKYFRNTVHVSAVENFNLCYRRTDPSSKYTAVLASDDWWEPGLLARLVAAGESNPTVTFIYSDMYRTEASGRVINRYSDQFAHNAPAGVHRAARELFFGNYINIMAGLINRRMREQIYPTKEFFDPELKLAPDYHLWLQLLIRGAYAYYIPEPLAYYRKHEEAMTMPTNVVPRLREEVTIFQDRLRGVCPPELEDARRAALLDRLTRIGFELLRRADANEARSALREAHAIRFGRRLDLTVARTISALPCSTALRARLWQLANSTSQALKEAH